MENLIKTKENLKDAMRLEEFHKILSNNFIKIPKIGDIFINMLNKNANKIESMLYESTAFLEIIKNTVPEKTLRAVLSDEQKMALADGSLEIMTKKDGSLLANLIDPKTKKIVSIINLEEDYILADINRVMIDYISKVQMAQIAELIRNVQKSVDEINQGQENDRLAKAESCEQKFFQLLKIKDEDIKNKALLEIAHFAEDSRNELMKSQQVNLLRLKEEPSSFFGKIIKGSSNIEISSRMDRIKESLNATNVTSFIQYMAYDMLGEREAAIQGLNYYYDYLEKEYFSDDGLLERLDSLDKAGENYWTITMPQILKGFKRVPIITEVK